MTNVLFNLLKVDVITSPSFLQVESNIFSTNPSHLTYVLFGFKRENELAKAKLLFLLQKGFTNYDYIRSSIVLLEDDSGMFGNKLGRIVISFKSER